MRTIKTIPVCVLAIGLLGGSAVGVTAQGEEEAAAVTSFTGAWSPDGEPLPDVEWANVELPNGFSEGEPGFAWRTTWVSSDERMAGDVYTVRNWVVDPHGWEPWDRGEQVNSLGANTFELTNDGGSWLGESTGFSSTELDIAVDIVTLVGQDGYEGLTASLLLDSTRTPATFSGVIFPIAMPEVPEPYAGE